MTRRFTGWHMAGIMVSFFGVVIAVNVVMATSAIRSFGGVVVDNSYVASQRFDTWLGTAREQERLGWHAVASVDANGFVLVDVNAPGGPLQSRTLAVRVEHPLGREPVRRLAMRPLGNGRFMAARPLEAGRWVLRIEAAGSGGTARFAEEVRL